MFETPGVGVGADAVVDAHATTMHATKRGVKTWDMIFMRKQRRNCDAVPSAAHASRVSPSRGDHERANRV
jgi:hypothetical protein